MSLQIDKRIGGYTRYYFGESEFMPIPDEVRKCVAFLAYKDAQGMIRLAGTIFFVAISLPGETLGGFGYAVTAKHVIDGIRQNSADGKVYIRLNLKNVGARLAESRIEDWQSHPTDSSVDVSAHPFPSSAEFDHLVFPATGIATADVIRTQSVGIGDEVFIVGLFVHHYGQQRNIPIIRMGNIAAMPEEKIQTRSEEIEAFLIESRSIGGLSGSPVFVNTAGARTVGNTIRVGGGGIFLLGLVHGHWDVSPSETDTMIVDNRRESVNVGIAIVAPAQKILEVLNHPVFKRARNEAISVRKTQNSPTADSGKGAS